MDVPPQFEVVAFLKELPELGWVGQFKQALVQGPILHPQNHKVKNRVCLLGLIPTIIVHAGGLQTIPYQVQDTQVTAAHLSRTLGPLSAVSCTPCTAAAVIQWCVLKVLGTNPSQDTFNKASASMLVFPAL